MGHFFFFFLLAWKPRASKISPTTPRMKCLIATGSKPGSVMDLQLCASHPRPASRLVPITAMLRCGGFLLLKGLPRLNVLNERTVMHVMPNARKVEEAKIINRGTFHRDPLTTTWQLVIHRE
jgi:hypothetical protein